MMDELYTKVLVARHSPKNGCYVPDGQVLVIVPIKSLPKKEQVAHFFVSVNDLKTRSKYGWVKEVEPFTLNSFLENHFVGRTLNDEALHHIKVMLASIKKLSPGTAVAATYSSRGIIEKSMALTVHRVIFYDP
jgi:hypothetical protein